MSNSSNSTTPPEADKPVALCNCLANTMQGEYHRLSCPVNPRSYEARIMAVGLSPYKVGDELGGVILIDDNEVSIANAALLATT